MRTGVRDWANDLKWYAIAYALVAGTALIALAVGYFTVPALRRSWLGVPRLRPVTWTGHEVLLAVCICFGLPMIVTEVLLQTGFYTNLIGPAPDFDPAKPEWKEYRDRCSAIGSPLVLTLVLGVLFAVLFARTGTRPHHYGLTRARWPANLALGAVGFMASMPIVIGIFAVLALTVGARDHPMTQLARHNPPAWEWVLLAFQATVAAPLLEEILLRGILQSWLRRASLVGHLTMLTFALFLLSGALLTTDAEKSVVFNFEQVPPALFGLALAAGYGFWMYSLANRFGLRDTEVQAWQPEPTAPIQDGLTSDEQARESRREARERDEQQARRWEQANAYLAIFGSAVMFAVVHPAWPAPVPLFLLGLLLGWLYHRTQSLVGPIALHALFNLVSFIALYGTVLSPPA